MTDIIYCTNCGYANKDTDQETLEDHGMDKACSCTKSTGKDYCSCCGLEDHEHL